MLKDVYLGDWDNLGDMLSSFGVDKSAVEGYKVIVANYEVDGYDGSAFVLLKKGRKYYEVHGGHCSCYGLEDQWGIEESDKAALKHRVYEGSSYGAFAQCAGVLKQHFGWETD